MRKKKWLRSVMDPVLQGKEAEAPTKNQPNRTR